MAISEQPDEKRLGLKYLTGPEAGRILLIKPPMKFGRHRDNNVALPYDDRASRYHAEIRHTTETEMELADLGSTNGSFRGETRLHSESAALQPGDTFRIGSTTFLFDMIGRLQAGTDVHLSEETCAIPTARMEAVRSETAQREAVLVVDMQSSTMLGHQLGESAMLRLKEHMFDILQRCGHRHGTAFTKNTGDGYMMTFTSLERAVSAIRAMVGECALYNAREDKIHHLDLRLSLTHGDTLCDHSGDRHGQIVNLAFRLNSLPPLPGETPGDPTSGETTPLITTGDLAARIREVTWDTPPPAPLHLPPQELKGFAEPVPVSIFQLSPAVGQGFC